MFIKYWGRIVVDLKKIKGIDQILDNSIRLFICFISARLKLSSFKFKLEMVIG